MKLLLTLSISLLLISCASPKPKKHDPTNGYIYEGKAYWFGCMNGQSRYVKDMKQKPSSQNMNDFCNQSFKDFIKGSFGVEIK